MTRSAPRAPIPRRAPVAALFALVLTGAACPTAEVDPTDTTAVATTTETDTDGNESLDPPVSSSSSSGRTSGNSPVDDDTTAGQETGSDTDLEAACQAYCDNLSQCFPDEGPAEVCVVQCVDDASEGTAGCVDAAADLYRCLADATCEALDGEAPVCVEEELAIDEVCADGRCTAGVGGDASACGYTYTCPDLSQQMSCNDQTCSCFEDDVEVGTCDAMDVCLDLAGIADYAAVCCGFV